MYYATVYVTCLYTIYCQSSISRDKKCFIIIKLPCALLELLRKKNYKSTSCKDNSESCFFLRTSFSTRFQTLALPQNICNTCILIQFLSGLRLDAEKKIQLHTYFLSKLFDMINNEISLRNTAALKKREYLSVLQEDERHVTVLLPKLQ